MTDHQEAFEAYATIVADPPWRYGKFGNFQGRLTDRTRYATDLPYPTMEVAEIAALRPQVDELAAADCHLYMWTTTRFMRASFEVMEAWGFEFSTVLTWVKKPMGNGMGGAFHPSTEFVLFGRRGSLAPTARWHQSHFDGKRPYRSDGKPMHSAKPEAFLDIVEAVSPGPYIEMFSRRARLGWDTWGNESLHGGIAS